MLVDPLFDDDIEKISMLLQAGADINARFADGDPVAEIAMRPYQADETLQFLIGAGVDIHAYGEGAPVWWAALQQGPTSKLRILLDAGVNPNACALWGVTALQRAIERENFEAVSMLIDAGANVDAFAASGNTLLTHAIQRSRLPAIPLLIDGGADVNAVDADGRTVLDEAIAYRVLPLYVQLLIGAGADVNATDAHGRTILDRAMVYQAPADIVQLLIDAGAVQGQG